MREILSDILRQSSSLFPAIKVMGTEEETRIQAQDTAKTFFMKAVLLQPQTELMGDFGISNMSLLSGLLNFASYRTDDATFKVKHRLDQAGNSFVEEFQFRDATGNGADYRTSRPDLEAIRNMAEIRAIPWTVHIEPQKSKLAEFSQLAGLYSEVQKTFSVKVVGTDLIFSIGDEQSSTHRVSMVFAPDIEGELNDTPEFSAQQFLAVMKLAGNNPVTASFYSGGILGITIDTPFARYEYFIRNQ